MAMTFPAGEPVEVRSADGAAWIEARVVRAFLLSRRYVVAYDNGTFNETFPAGRVRPRPSPSPAGAGAGAQFRRYQIVEVFSDGWWRAGVLFKVHAASEEWRYDVCFPEKREEWEFGSAEVRAKLDWVDGEWVPAEGKETAETLYGMGTLVEVASVNKKLPVAWYPAIVNFVVVENIFVVEYETLRSDNGSSLKEIVVSKDVRPYPPCAYRCKSFNLLDEVEALYGNGWWPGVIAKVNTGSRFNVKFLHWEEEIEFGFADLRLLYDWVDGQWVQASQDKSIKSQIFGGKKSDGHRQLFHASSSPHIYKVPVAVTPSSSDGDEARCKLPTYPRNLENKNSDILTYQSKLESPCKKSEKEATTDDNRRLLDFLVVDQGTNTSSGVNAEVDLSTVAIEVEPNFCIKALAEKHYSRSPSKTINMVSQLTATKSSSNILLGDVNDDSLIPEKSSQKSSLLHAPGSIIGLVDKAEGTLKPGAKLSGTKGFLRAAEWEQHEGVCPMVDGEWRIRLVSNQSQGDEGIGHLPVGEKRRKNSRPWKLTIVEPSLQGDSIRNQQDNQAVCEPPSEGLSTSHPEARTRRGTNSKGFEALDLLDSAIGSPDASLVETSLSGVQLSETGSETQNEVLLNNTVGPLAKRAPSKQASEPLPFEKRSSTWDLIESMEVFSRMPQQPHFCPLNQQCKELREGLAIGLMVTFSNSANSIALLRITDSRNKFDERLKVLLQLQAHGFDVEHIRSRITELLRMKDDLEHVMVKRSEMKAALTEKRKEREQLSGQIESVGKFAMEFEHTLSKIQDLRNSIAKQSMEKNSEVAKLQVDSRTVENALQSDENTFEVILSADWHTL
ncbi:Uncharacterized protein M6B38_221855 [Iris pallida]|uniref:Agenet domain-containing protein n=1 Tax=Iris pallida TaxID=29817 RepID=A0AAX6DW72_IRIPA|nr:Uncharacterized protein M6B38_221855 [Iris pallida]